MIGPLAPLGIAERRAIKTSDVIFGTKYPVANGIKSFFLKGPAGKLEALLNEGQPDAAHAALVCHPHPLYGGTMHNKVVYHAMKALNGFGFPILRFNFRGAGLSEGEHDKGQGEQGDVRAALEWLEAEYRLPMIFCGFSFGAATGLRVACGNKHIAGLISLGTPVSAEGRVYTYHFMQNCAQPKLFVSGSRDQYGATENVRKVVDLAPEPRELVVVEDAGHFFEGHLPEMQAAIRNWIEKFFKPGKQAEAS
ncbi:MAG TPA: alpha/beta fold hydrolase [Candidatus Angelobacter sp.]|nr:alpha/beta fold hydrolase [Candidatus Angelobacter sp.]